jgi:hypothetical protein
VGVKSKRGWCLVKDRRHAKAKLSCPEFVPSEASTQGERSTTEKNDSTVNGSNAWNGNGNAAVGREGKGRKERKREEEVWLGRAGQVRTNLGGGMGGWAKRGRRRAGQQERGKEGRRA